MTAAREVHIFAEPGERWLRLAYQLRIGYGAS
jgi:hypothetical protein